VKRNSELEAVIRTKYEAISPVLDERARRLWAAAESQAIGYGGDAIVSAATGLARATIRAGRAEFGARRDGDGTCAPAWSWSPEH